MTVINFKKEKFYNDSKVFFEENLLNELYSSENLSICNLANQCYGVFPYMDTKEGQACLLVTSNQVQLIANDETFFNRLISGLDKKVLNERSIALNERTLELMRKMKATNDINGPTKDIDLEMEEQLKAKNKSR